jgi:hypothetical protein
VAEKRTEYNPLSGYEYRFLSSPLLKRSICFFSAGAAMIRQTGRKTALR